jgi:hypothetical protein
VGFEGEIGIGRDRRKHLAGFGYFAVIFGNQFLLKVHTGNLLCSDESINQDQGKSEQKAINFLVHPQEFCRWVQLESYNQAS